MEAIQLIEKMTRKKLLEELGDEAEKSTLPPISKINFVERKSPAHVVLEVWVQDMANHLVVIFRHLNGKRIIEIQTRRTNEKVNKKLNRWIEMGVKNSLLALCQTMAGHGYRKGLLVWDSIPEE